MCDFCHSRMMVVRAYPRETQEMVFDALRRRALRFLPEKPPAGASVYDNMKTAAETIFLGKDRQYNRRFLQDVLASSCRAGRLYAGVRDGRRARSRTRSASSANASSRRGCDSRATTNSTPGFSTNAFPGRKRMPIPSGPDQTIWEVFEAERPKLIAYRGRVDGFHALPAAVSKTSLVRFDNNKYSGQRAPSAAPRRHPRLRRSDRCPPGYGRTVAEHRRCYGRGKTIYDPWHYVPVLARKPGALRNGAPFKDWVLPAALDRVRRRLAGSNDGDRQMVKILAAVLTDEDCLRLRRLAFRRSPKASIPPTSSSTFWPASATQGH